MTYHENCYTEREAFSDGGTSSPDYSRLLSLKNPAVSASTPLKGLHRNFWYPNSFTAALEQRHVPLCVH